MFRIASISSILNTGQHAGEVRRPHPHTSTPTCDAADKYSRPTQNGGLAGVPTGRPVLYWYIKGVNEVWGLVFVLPFDIYYYCMQFFFLIQSNGVVGCIVIKHDMGSCFSFD